MARKLKIGTLPSKTRRIHPPRGGWKERAYYVVLVSFNAGNPIHQAIFFSGYLTKGGAYESPAGQPAGYNQVLSPFYSDTSFYRRSIDRLHYLKVIEEISSMRESRLWLSPSSTQSAASPSPSSKTATTRSAASKTAPSLQSPASGLGSMTRT